ALELLGRKTPGTVEDWRRLQVEAGLSRIGLAPSALRRAAEMAGTEFPHVKEASGRLTWLDRPRSMSADRTLRFEVPRLAQRLGAAPMSLVMKRAPGADEAQVAAEAEEAGWLLEEGW